MPLDPAPRFANFFKSLHNPRVRSDPHALARDASTTTTNNAPLDFTHGTIYAREGRLYCSPNSLRIVNHPPPLEDNLSLKFDAAGANPMTLHQPRWWSEETAYLAFISLVPKYVGLHAKHSLPPFNDPMEIHKFQVVKADKRGFGLEPWRKLAWYALERKILVMVDTMRFKYSLPPIHQVVDNTLSLKSFYQDKHTFFSEANRAMKWFSAIAAQMTWSIAMGTTLDDEIGTALEDEMTAGFSKRPSWLDFLSKCPGKYWDETTLQSVRKSMGAFGIQRPKVGVFINVLNPPQHQYSAEWLMKFGVPVYYFWDTAAIAEALRNPAVARFTPPTHLMQDLLVSIQDVCKLHFIPLPDNISRAIEEHLPPSQTILTTQTPQFNTNFDNPDDEPAPIDDQDKHLRPWFLFSQSRMAETARAISKESSKDTHARQQRERNPPTVNTCVYIWEEGNDGVYSRVQVRKNDNHDTLASFRPRMKTYNAVFNEWDCSYDFAVNDTASDHGYVSDDDDDVYQYQGYFDNPDTDIAVPLPEPCATFASDEDGRDIASTDMLTLYREYFGYVPPLSLQADCDSFEEKYAMHVRNFVGMTKDQCDGIRRQTIQDLHAFATQVLRHKASMSLPTAPVDKWDLVFGNRQYLGNHTLLKGLSIVVSPGGSTYFMLDFGCRRTEEWNLLLCSSLTVLFVCRLDSSLSEKAICSELMRRGIQFFTVLPLQLHKRIMPRIMSSDVLPANYQFTRQDYQCYIDFRTDLLDSSRTCRAALMRGGIVWRLSLSHAKSTEESVLLGPTKYVRQQGMSMAFNNGSLHDDCITLEELDVICGTYECLTGKGLQTVTMSWWPPYSIWNQCYDYEYWTHAMEARFRERLRCIDAGTASPMSKQQWRDWVRGGKITRDAKISIMNACDGFVRDRAAILI